MMPAASSRSRPRSVIQSVVQAGLIANSTTGSNPARSHGRGDVVTDLLGGRAPGVGRGEDDMRDPTLRSTSTERTIPRSPIVTWGSSGSSISRIMFVEGVDGRSPRRPRVGTSEHLHLADQVRERFGVAPVTPAGLHDAVARGSSSVASSSASTDDPSPLAPEVFGVGRDAAVDQAGLDVVALEQLAGEPPQVVDAGLHAAMALVGAVAEAHHPTAAVAEVVGGLLDGLAGQRRRASRRSDAVIACQYGSAAASWRNWRAMTCAKSPFGCSTSSGFRNSCCSRQ